MNWPRIATGPPRWDEDIWIRHCTFQVKLDKVILKPVWAYGIQLWGAASNSNLEILERFQSKVLRIITDAPWFIPNTVIKHDLQVPTIKQEARKYSVNYRKRFDVHPNSRLSEKFFHHCSTHQNPLVRQIRDYTMSDLQQQYKKYIHKRTKHLLL